MRRRWQLSQQNGLSILAYGLVELFYLFVEDRNRETSDSFHISVTGRLAGLHSTRYH